MKKFVSCTLALAAFLLLLMGCSSPTDIVHTYAKAMREKNFDAYYACLEPVTQACTYFYLWERAQDTSIEQAKAKLFDGCEEFTITINSTKQQSPDKIVLDVTGHLSDGEEIGGDFTLINVSGEWLIQFPDLIQMYGGSID